MVPANYWTQEKTEIQEFKWIKVFNISLALTFAFHFAAPSQAPNNLRWEQQGSQLSLGWDPVRPLANESEVMGYKVSVCSLS